jgi:tRNA threonylcarbamoyladenosine biosynthesis protein TsaE
MHRAVLSLADEAATVALGARLARALERAPRRSWVLYLQGELGSGKTSLARGLLQALGVGGAIRSPTYTLVEPYATRLGSVWHADLYRLQHPAEAQPLGLEEGEGQALLIVEWPERGQPQLRAADLTVQMTYAPTGRTAAIELGSEAGQLQAFQELLREVESAVI